MNGGGLELPVRAYRIDYADGASHTDSQGPPQRTDGVLAVVWWYDRPYRTLEYGQDFYVVDGVTLSGAAVGDAEWETYRLNLHAEPHLLEG